MMSLTVSLTMSLRNLLPYWNLIIAGMLFALDLYFGLRAAWRLPDVLDDYHAARVARRKWLVVAEAAAEREPAP